MPMDPIFQFGVFYALLCHCVFGSVPSATNVSVVCHNFVNVLYWNYSHPAEQLKFSVLVKPYQSDPQTVDTSQTYLDISNYSKDAADDYSVSVTAHVGQEKSESASIKFTYSEDFYDAIQHKYKCSLDFPAVNDSVHKDVIEVSFWHPSLIYEQDIPDEEFIYTITHDQKKTSYLCFYDEDVCTAKIHLKQSLAGRCVELKFEGKIAAIPTYTYKNVCVPEQTPETDHTGLIAALLGGGFVLLFITVGVVWVLYKKWNDWPKVPEVLRSIIPGQTTTALLPQSEQPAFPQPQRFGHQPLLNEISHESGGSTPDSPVCEITDLDDTDPYEPKLPITEDSDGESTVIEPSGYNSPKNLEIEIGPEDFAEGYGPRPAVI
ncbi:interferon gamma receptor 1-like [Megalobrama amblycephala]|uniref:interferon gamma receptor 1-like n=1 Tax=Megalobrama amblycephala TaxID=75352 RepID=UPI002013E481|nr:interferon gamma receptor 1-like [Megalobrama amblycephala]WRW24787.1 cytokine receptor family member B13 [Megalobrama amblycephala]